MKNIFKERKIHIACVCLLLVMLLAGCSNSDTNNQETDLFDVLNRADSVKIGNHIVVYNSESGNICYGEMVNDKPKIIKNIALPYKNANVNQIIASDICSSGIEQDGYTAEPYTFSRKKQNKILKELNLTNEKFDMSMLQDGDNIYGYCNVFKDGWVYNMYKGIDLKDIKKAFTFCYYFKSKKFKILQTFTNGELLGLANSEEVIYRKGNAIYTQALLDAKKTQKIFNCSHYGEIYAWGDIKKGSGISPVKNSSGKYFEVTEKNTILSDEEKFVVSIE